MLSVPSAASNGLMYGVVQWHLGRESHERVLVQVPNVTVAEINIELEFQMTFVLEYDASANVWGAPAKAKAGHWWQPDLRSVDG